MTQLISWLSSNTAVALGIMGSALAFIVSSTLQILQRRTEAREHGFKAFHRLVKDLVSPETLGGTVWEDRQAAVAFELRNFPRYYEFSERMLLRLRAIWGAWPRLIEEIDLTLKYIKENK